MNKDVTFTTEEAQSILNYLATKPYAEVFQIINLIGVRMQGVKTPTPKVEDKPIKEEDKPMERKK